MNSCQAGTTSCHNVIDDGDIDAMEYNNIKASFIKAERSQAHPEEKQRAVIECMVNMANISGNVSSEKYKLIEQKAAMSDIDDEDKLELLGNLGTEHDGNKQFNYDVDYDLLACDPDDTTDALRSMIAVVHADGTQPSTAERMYLTMTAKTLGVDKETLAAMM